MCELGLRSPLGAYLKSFPTPFPIDQSTSTPGNALSWCPLICGNYARGCWPITAALQLSKVNSGDQLMLWRRSAMRISKSFCIFYVNCNFKKKKPIISDLLHENYLTIMTKEHTSNVSHNVTRHSFIKTLQWLHWNVKTSSTANQLRYRTLKTILFIL